MRHALGKLGERLETTVLEINEQGKEIDRLRVAVAGKILILIPKLSRAKKQAGLFLLQEKRLR